MRQSDGTALGGSLVFVELCGIYTHNPDPSKGHPNYRYGTIAKADGTFELTVPRGTIGLHTFLPGYRYGALEVADSTAAGIEVHAESLLPEDRRPAISDFRVSASEVQAGAPISFSVNVRAVNPKDPISEEVLIVEPRTSIARALTPPRRGIQGKGFPDGLWTTTIGAPSAPGEYTYTLGVTSEQCIVGDDGQPAPNLPTVKVIVR